MKEFLLGMAVAALCALMLVAAAVGLPALVDWAMAVGP